jgi:hypothetical protein
MNDEKGRLHVLERIRLRVSHCQRVPWIVVVVALDEGLTFASSKAPTGVLLIAVRESTRDGYLRVAAWRIMPRATSRCGLLESSGHRAPGFSA